MTNQQDKLNEGGEDILQNLIKFFSEQGPRKSIVGPEQSNTLGPLTTYSRE